MNSQIYQVCSTRQTLPIVVFVMAMCFVHGGTLPLDGPQPSQASNDIKSRPNTDSSDVFNRVNATNSGDIEDGSDIFGNGSILSDGNEASIDASDKGLVEEKKNGHHDEDYMDTLGGTYIYPTIGMIFVASMVIVTIIKNQITNGDGDSAGVTLVPASVYIGEPGNGSPVLSTPGSVGEHVYQESRSTQDKVDTGDNDIPAKGDFRTIHPVATSNDDAEVKDERPATTGSKKEPLSPKEPETSPDAMNEAEGKRGQTDKAEVDSDSSVTTEDEVANDEQEIAEKVNTDN